MSVCQAMVIVKDHDGAENAAGNHDHDTGEVSTNQRCLVGRRLHVRNLGKLGMKISRNI